MLCHSSTLEWKENKPAASLLSPLGVSSLPGKGLSVLLDVTFCCLQALQSLSCRGECFQVADDMLKHQKTFCQNIFHTSKNDEHHHANCVGEVKHCWVNAVSLVQSI
ncbi:unnamed protein product [Durusdinium trenchii]|uniref:Uncharacterized protein n=1 Tax=Durusdinium trenchii TaxID=1381693 RepID=A0ABP0K5G9_9DINO